MSDDNDRLKPILDDIFDDAFGGLEPETQEMMRDQLDLSKPRPPIRFIRRQARR